MMIFIGFFFYCNLLFLSFNDCYNVLSEQANEEKEKNGEWSEKLKWILWN